MSFSSVTQNPATSTVHEYAHETTTAGSIRRSFMGRLKDMYMPAWDDHVHTDTFIASKLAKKKGTMGGKRMLGSVMNVLPQSAGVALLEYDSMPTPSTGSHFNPQLISKQLYSRLRFSNRVKDAARAGDKAAWAAPQREEIEGAKKQFEINFERMLFLGNRDILATVSSSSSDHAHTCVARNSRTSAANYRWAFGTHYLRNDMQVAVVRANSSNVDTHDGALDDPAANTNIRYVRDVTSTGFTLSSTIGSTTNANWSTAGANESNAVIIPWGSRRVAATVDNDGTADAAETDSLFSAMNGLGNLAVSSSEVAYVYGLARSSIDSLNGRMIQNGGTVRPFDERFVHLAVDRISDEGKGDEPDSLVTHRSVLREMVRETAGDRRFEPVQESRGFKKIAYMSGNVSLEVDASSRDCPPGSVFILDTSSFGYLEECPMKMLDDGERFVADKAASEIIMVKSGNVMTKNPFNNCVIEDIAFDVSALTA